MIDMILGAIPSVVVVFSLDLKVTVWNPAAEVHLGVEIQRTQGQQLVDLPVAWDGSAVYELVRKCLESSKTTKNDAVTFTRRDGHPGTLGVTAIPLFDESQQLRGVLFLAADRTERLAEERHFMQAQKLESIGQLAAGIAHEINTPTQYVSDNARYLLRVFQRLDSALQSYKELLDDATLEDPRLVAGRQQWTELKLESVLEKAPEAIKEALEGLDRIATIVRAMKEFSHPGSLEKSPTNLNHCIESTVTVARNEWKYVAAVELELDPELPSVPCLAGEFNQVVLNMLVNASHAIADRFGDSGELGTITVSTKQAGDHVVVSISDTGNGIPIEARSRIFDPFFTTKEVGKGTGQGLALAHDVIVRRHGGQITVESECGVGTTFSIVLPLTAAEEELAA